MITSQDRKHRIQVYESKKNGRDESGCVIYDYVLVGKAWGQIIASGGKENNHDGNVTDYEISCKVRVRKELYHWAKGMIIKYQNYRYEVLYVQPVYNQPELLELGCKLVVEGAELYGDGS
jgi:hypothetical protein